MYEHYKPLRNFVRNLDQTTSLVQIWWLLQNITYGLPLPADFQRFDNQSVKGIIYPWELEILAREVILHGGYKSKRNLFKVNDLLIAIGHIRRLVNQQSNGYISENNVLHEMHRITQQQFPWQKGHQTKLARYLKIFRYKDLSAILIEATGLTVEEIYLICTSIAGNFLKRYVWNTKINYNGFGISDEKRDLFLSRIVIEIAKLKERTRQCQEYNENWCYTINPLLSTPLIIIDPEHTTKVICPVPRYIFDRCSEGLIYDIYGVKGYEQPLGNAFQSYVKDISNRLIENSTFEVADAKEYYVKKEKKHGIDLYLFDEYSAMLIECKAKRLDLKSKYQSNNSELTSHLKLLAKFVVQNYKNLSDIVNNHTPWKSSNRSLYPVIVTLMELYIWTPDMLSVLDSFVVQKMKDAKINEQLKEKFPYTIMSIDEYELSLQIIRQVGIRKFFEDMRGPAYSGWSVDSFIKTHYQTLLVNCGRYYLSQELDEVLKKFNI